MAVKAEDCLTPSGRLNGAALWPSGGKNNPKGYDESAVENTLLGYIAQGYTKTASDPAVLLWTYYRAYQEVYERLLMMPSSVAVSDQGSSSYTQGQIDLLGQLAAQMLAEFEDLVIPVEAAGAAYATIQSLR